MFPRIFIAVDGGAPSARAARTGIELAESLGAKVALFHAVEPPSYIAQATEPPIDLAAFAHEKSDEVLSAAAREMPSAMDFVPLAKIGDPAEAIIAEADWWEASLIVLGSHGRDGITRAVLGSVAEAVMRHAWVPILVIRASPGAGATPSPAKEQVGEP